MKLILQIAAGVLLALLTWNFFPWVLGGAVVIWIVAVIYNNLGPAIARGMSRVGASPIHPHAPPLSHLSLHDMELRRRIDAGEDVSKVLDDARDT